MSSRARRGAAPTHAFCSLRKTMREHESDSSSSVSYTHPRPVVHLTWPPRGVATNRTVSV